MTIEATNEIKRRIHLQVDELWKKKDLISGEELKKAAETIKKEIENYQPWDSCTLFCFRNPYWKYTDLTERIREMIVLGMAKISDNLNLQKGIRSGEIAAESYRGQPTTAEKIAALSTGPIPAFLYAASGGTVPGGGKLDATTAEIGGRMKGEIKNQVCCWTKSLIPLPEFLSSKIVDCKCDDTNHASKKIRWVIWAGVVIGILILIHPYVSVLSKMIPRK